MWIRRVNDMTVKEMITYVDVAIDKIEKANKEITKQNILEELSFLAYHRNKKDILLERNITVEKFF